MYQLLSNAEHAPLFVIAHRARIVAGAVIESWRIDGWRARHIRRDVVIPEALAGSLPDEAIQPVGQLIHVVTDDGADQRRIPVDYIKVRRQCQVVCERLFARSGG